MDIASNIEEIKQNIERYSKSAKVRLIAVTKTVDIPTIEELIRCGVTDLAENKTQLLEKKAKELGKYTNLVWHLIGHLQTNKIKKVLPIVEYIHSVDSIHLACAIDEHAGKTGKRVKVLLQINVSGEKSKYGFQEDEFLDNISALKNIKNIDIIGLMTMAPLSASDPELHTIFKRLFEFGERINSLNIPTIKISEYSMGMSDDYIVALQEGATMIRVGSAIFK